MTNQTLRELAKDYAKGTTGKNRYHKSRTDLIQGIVSGSIPVKPIDYEAPLKPSNEIEDAITEGIQRDKTQITSPQARAKQPPASVKQKAPVKKPVIKKKNNSPFIFILVSMAIVLFLIIAVFMFYPKPPTSEITQTSNVTSETRNVSNVTVSSKTSTVGESLIANFLNEKDWTEASMDNFIESWTALTMEEKNSAMQTKRMQRMNDSIYKQFRQGKALASIDSEKALIKQQKLIEFSKSIGINDSRLVLD